MEKINLKNDIQTFGIEVKDFPNGIGKAFEELVKMLPTGDRRSYYGIFQMNNGHMHYYATAEERKEGEAEEYGCESFVVSRGEYLAESITNWRAKTDSIKDVFENMNHDSRVDKTKPGIEWYKNDKEMLCLLQMRSSS